MQNGRYFLHPQRRMHYYAEPLGPFRQSFQRRACDPKRHPQDQKQFGFLCQRMRGSHSEGCGLEHLFRCGKQREKASVSGGDCAGKGQGFFTGGSGLLQKQQWQCGYAGKMRVSHRRQRVFGSHGASRFSSGCPDHVQRPLGKPGLRRSAEGRNGIYRLPVGAGSGAQ